jgi:ADP-ribosylglycohydrolase
MRNFALRGMLGLVLAFQLFSAGCATHRPTVTFNESEFRDKVYACWLGKNIGGTLGMPFEGQQKAQNISFYTNLKPGEPAPNDDLDLQILWLKAMEENNARVDARILGEYWLKYVPVDWNEYGVGKRNMKRGILPPLSGEFDNAKWKPSNGAWIRSEIWACLAPGCPGWAAQMAREDACVDHGAAEGTLAEIFTASVESAAFVEHDRDKLIAIGLSMIPKDCGVARAIRTAIAAKNAGKTWQQAREDVIEATKDTGWFQAPRNVAFTMIGWLYGEGDFGQSICIAINCGDDTDCTGATLGSIFGIIHGTKGIPEKWSKPIGTEIKNVAISGFPAPKDLNELTDHTVAMTGRVIAKYNLPVALSDAPTDLSHAKALTSADMKLARNLWGLSPYQIVWTEQDVQVTLDYLRAPLIEPSASRPIRLTVHNLGSRPKVFTVKLVDLPKGWSTSNWPAREVGIDANEAKVFEPTIVAPADAQTARMSIRISDGLRTIVIPLAFVESNEVAAVGPDDLALASKGATVTSDGELDREPGCTPRAIDGIVATETDFGNRWHSSLSTAHPHWIQVKLPKPTLIGRVVIRFADPGGYPVSFQGLVKPAEGQDLKVIFDVSDNKNTRIYKAKIDPVLTDTFRLVIRSSANPAWPNAAQISEIELYSPGK